MKISTGFPRLDKLIDKVMSLDLITGLSLTVNETSGNAIYTGPVVFLAGKETITEPVGDLSLEMSAAGFSQLNSQVAGAMYDYARQETPLAKIVWDLYCGLGGLGLTAALGRDIRLFGVDAGNSVIRLARINAAKTGVDARYETADLSTELPADWPPPDVVLINPPRRGLDPLVRDYLMKSRPRQIIYMSCSPASFARDAGQLINQGWTIKRIQAHDMLPGTAHVELIACFER